MSSKSRERTTGFSIRNSMSNILRDKNSSLNRDRQPEYKRSQKKAQLDKSSSHLYSKRHTEREGSIERRDRKRGERGHSKEKENRQNSKYLRNDQKMDIPASHFIQHHRHLSRSMSKERTKHESSRPALHSKKDIPEEELLNLRSEIDQLRKEKELREKEFHRTNREMKEIKSSLRANQEFLLALKKDMVHAQTGSNNGPVDDYAASKVYYH